MPVTEYFEDLLQVLLDEKRELRPSQLSELSDLTSQQVEAFRTAWQDSATTRRREIVHTLGRLAEEHIELLFEQVNRQLLNDPDSAVRRQAIANLWESEDAQLAEYLITATREDPDDGVREQAVQALGRFVYLGEVDKISRQLLHEIEEALLEILHGEGAHPIRRAALRSLGYSSRPEIPHHIRAAYRSEREAEVRSGLIAMGRSADRSWLPQVLAVLDHPAPAIRAEAARAAGELEARRATSSLIDLTRDAHPDVRHAAIWALGQVGGDKAREALLELQQSQPDAEHEQVIDEALEYIAFLDATPDLSLSDYDVEVDD